MKKKNNTENKVEEVVWCYNSCLHIVRFTETTDGLVRNLNSRMFRVRIMWLIHMPFSPSVFLVNLIEILHFKRD